MVAYKDMKPKKKEEVYVGWDEEFEYYGVFGLDSGFCYAQFPSQNEAIEWIINMNWEVKA